MTLKQGKTDAETRKDMGMKNIIEQLKRAIEAYEGPLPASGNSIEEVWFRQAVKQLNALETGE